MRLQVKMLRGLLLPLFGLCLSSPVWAQSSATLLVTTDTNCDWKLDGVSQGRLNVDDAKVVKTTAGEHLLQATSADGQPKWQGTVTADSSTQKLVKISLSEMPWVDPATGLMWTRKDNGSVIYWFEAGNYCANLQLNGYSGWRLPTIDELAAIYVPNQNMDGSSIKGGILAHGWIWSTSAEDDKAWAFGFGFNRRALLPLSGYGDNRRALCVRRSGA